MSDPLLLESMTLSSHDPADLVAASVAGSGLLARVIARWRAPWMRDAACADQPVELFFPSNGRYAAGLQVCGRCPVRSECLAEALADDRLDHGLRGGLTPEARKQRRRTTRPTRPDPTTTSEDQP